MGYQINEKNEAALGMLRSFLKKICKQHGAIGSSMYNFTDDGHCRMITYWGALLEENDIPRLVKKPDVLEKLSGRRPALISIGNNDSKSKSEILILPVMKRDALWGILVHNLSTGNVQGSVILDMLQDCADLSRYFIPLLGIEENIVGIVGLNSILKEHLPSIYLMMSPDLQILDAKGSGLQDIKMLPETLIGKQFQTIVSEGKIDQKILMAIKGRRITEDILIVNIAAGVKNWYSVTSYPEWINQHLERIHMIMTDINQLKNGYIEIKTYRDKIEYYGNSLIDGIILLDGEFRIIHRTASAIRVLSAYEGMREPKYLMDMLDEASAEIVKEKLEQIRKIAQEKWDKEGTVTLNPSGKPLLRFIHKGQGTKNPSAQIQTETNIEISITYLPANDPISQMFILVLREVDFSDEHQQNHAKLPGMYIECDSNKIIKNAFSANINGWMNIPTMEFIGKKMQHFTGQVDIHTGINEITWEINSGKKKVLFDCDCPEDGTIRGYLAQEEFKREWEIGNELVLLEYLCESSSEIVLLCDLNLNTRYVSSNVKNILGYDPKKYSLMELGLTYNSQSLNNVVELFIDGYTAMINGDFKWSGNVVVCQAKVTRKWIKGKMQLTILSNKNNPLGFVIRTQFRLRKKNSEVR